MGNCCRFYRLSHPRLYWEAFVECLMLSSSSLFDLEFNLCSYFRHFFKAHPKCIRYPGDLFQCRYGKVPLLVPTFCSSQSPIIYVFVKTNLMLPLKPKCAGMVQSGCQIVFCNRRPSKATVGAKKREKGS